MIKAFFKAIKNLISKQEKELDKEPMPRIDADASRAVRKDAFTYEWQLFDEAYNTFSTDKDFKTASNYITSFIYNKPAQQLNSDTESTTSAQAQAPGADVAPDENAPSNDDKAISDEVIRMARTLGFVEQEQPETESEPQAELSAEPPAPVQMPTTQESPKVDAAQIGDTEPTTTPAPAQARAQGVENVEKSTVDTQKTPTDSFIFDDPSILESTAKAPTIRKKNRRKSTKKVDAAQIESEPKRDTEPTTPAQAQAPGEDVVQSQTGKILSPQQEKNFSKLLEIRNYKEIYETLTADEKAGLQKRFTEWNLEIDLFPFYPFVNFEKEKNQQTEQKTEQKTELIPAAATRAALPHSIDDYLHSSTIEIYSALFNVQPTHALKAHHLKQITSINTYEILTSGSDLNMYDKITFNALIRLAQAEQEKHQLIKGQKKPVPFLGETIVWNSSDILRAAGRVTKIKKGEKIIESVAGKARYEALDLSITRLSSVTFHVFKIKRNGEKEAFIVGQQLIRGAKDTKTKKWHIQFNPALENFYKKGSYALIPIESQHRLANNFLALKLFEIFLSNQVGVWHPLFIETLRKWTGTQIKTTRVFKQKIKDVLKLIENEMKNNGFNFEHNFSTNKDGLELLNIKIEQVFLAEIITKAQK